jgi:hypothetical protein
MSTDEVHAEDMFAATEIADRCHILAPLDFDGRDVETLTPGGRKLNRANRTDLLQPPLASLLSRSEWEQNRVLEPFYYREACDD